MWCAYADEVKICLGGALVVLACELNAALSNDLLEGFVEAWFMEREDARSKSLELLDIRFDAKNLVAKFCHCDCVGGT